MAAQRLTGAVDIGGTKIQVGIVDNMGKTLSEDCFPTACRQQSAQQAMDKICQSIRQQCRKIGVQERALQGIGISCAGPVDVRAGIIENPYTLGEWQGFHAVDYLARQMGIEIRMENDANGALLGELFQRDIINRKVLMLTFGTGIGVAFWNGKALHRSGKYHPEMGHVIVSSKGEKCYCGHRGCFESRCSGKALNHRAVENAHADFDELYLKAKEGEKDAEDVLEEILQDMKNGIWNLNIIFKPDVIILAGGLAGKYYNMIKNAILGDSAGKEDFLNRFEILPASDTQNPALVGANMLFMEEI